MADTESLVKQLGDCAERQDFVGALAYLRENIDDVEKRMQPAGVKDALKKTTKDRLLLSFLDGIQFGGRPLGESLVKIEKLMAFNSSIPGPAGVKVLNDAWGLGTVKKIDYFYKRVTVDFKTKRGHQFTFEAACDMLEVASKDHILVLRETAPADFERLFKEDPAEFTKAVIRSNGGSMTQIRLEDYCVSNSLVKSANWKKFWEAARVGLRKDKTVTLPVKKTEPIVVDTRTEDYGDLWLSKFCAETDPKMIMAGVREYVANGSFASADDAVKAKICDRLVFAATAVRKVDDALYARIACTVTELGLPRPPAQEMREYLWERKRFVKAAADLPAREVGAMIAFLAADAASKSKLYKVLPELCFTAVSEIVSAFGSEPECRAEVAALMKEPKAPATLTTLLAGRYEKFRDWSELPPLITILTHAIALGEGRQGGEVLKMQNIVRRLFGDKKWLADMFNWLPPQDKVLFFERFQASIAWDPSTHHATVVRMTAIAPELKDRVVAVEKKKEYPRITSFRSFAARKLEYLKLINEDMPANIKRIEFAKSYGDLSENAEYQYAKDEQRALMQKQTRMQAELEAVKPGDFADATVDEVMPGVTVVCETSGGEKTWTILGEWDNDLEKGVISSMTRVARNLLGKKPGDSFELPGENGEVEFATVKEIRPISDEIREWMKLPEGVQI